MGDDLPDLRQTIASLSEITRETRSAKDIANVYVAAVAFMCHVKVDHRTLGEYKLNGGDNAECPPPELIPAITAVLQEKALFRALLRCLQVSHQDKAEVELPRPGSSSVVARKRSLSLVSSEPVANKSFKTNHSPLPGPRHKPMLSVPQLQEHKPSLPVAVVAANILYAAFSHVDHWPALLVKAYADDCFGPRLWVDDGSCRLLVQNLILCHETKEDAMDEDLPEERAAEAKRVADAYRIFEHEEAEVISTVQEFTVPLSPADLRRRGSLSSTGSHSFQRLPSGGNSSDSGGEDDGCLLNSNSNEKKLGASDDGDSSSSGEEEEGDEKVVVTTNGTSPPKNPLGEPKTRASSTKKAKRPERRYDLYPIPQNRLNLERVRQRFFGANLANAHKSISSSLSDRLDVKSKQNSGLLQSLPLFAAIPAVREMVAENLEKWLQSPALAGLARTLFAAIVNNIKNADPPLESDLKAVDSILGMRLKANQLNAHIENITAIAKRIPTATLAHRMYAKLLPQVLNSAETADTSSADKLKMVLAVHKVVEAQVSYDAVAATLLTMLVQGAGDEEAVTSAERNRRVKKLRSIIRVLATELAPAFDGCALMDSLLSFDVSGTWTLRDEEDKARLMFQCITMHASVVVGDSKNDGAKLRQPGQNGWSPSTKGKLKGQLLAARKMMLSWCSTDYGPRCSTIPKRRRNPNGHDNTETAGAGAPDFRSALGPAVDEEKIPQWLNVMRCLLFLEDADSALMKLFVIPDAASPEDEAEWADELMRIRLCCDYGASVDDEMVWIVIKACGVPEGGLGADVAIELLENLFECCSKNRSGILTVNDPTIVWELYSLAEFVAPEPPAAVESESDDHGSAGSAERRRVEVPRLAYPGLWWRVTVLALVLCGRSPDSIGAVVWEENPTLRSLVKMIVSNRYRFPTVDCDDRTREEMKKAEQAARDQEASLAELLFLPKIKDAKQNNKTKKSGSRISKRLQKQQKEKEAALLLAETNRRRKQLKAAQRSIMLWDPDGPARKPPREAADLLLSVEQLFGLSEVFQRSVEPDFLLMTLGGTSRGAIERAYDWLIPVISRLPATIGRLPSSASCFLLLRAYGTDGEERTQLKELSSPLLSHVADCLQGKHGKSDSVKAFDLLMSDVASHKADRRRCARRVLHDAIIPVEGGGSVGKSWMLGILKVDFAADLVDDAIKYMSTAATYERGRVLRSLILALEQHVAFAKSHGVDSELQFPELLVELISKRPSVFAEAIDSFADLRSVVIRIIHGAFSTHRLNGEEPTSTNGDVVRLTLEREPSSSNNTDTVVIGLPHTLLQATSVLLSIWKDTANEVVPDETASAVKDLVDALLRNDVPDVNSKGDVGLASAIHCGSGAAAVSVELWIMLAKARSDTIARRAALSAPTGFLPRLLLCSGLPRASLVTMIDRLDVLGDSAADKGAVYRQLLEPSASSEWDIGRVGHRRDVSRKLLGRLAAYTRLNAIAISGADAQLSGTFLGWLSGECSLQREKPKKPKSRKSGKSSSKKAAALLGVKAVTELVASAVSTSHSEVEVAQLQKADEGMESFMTVDSGACLTPEDQVSLDAIDLLLKSKGTEQIDRWLTSLSNPSASCKQTDQVSSIAVAMRLLDSYETVQQKSERTTRLVLSWVPFLTRVEGTSDLWSKLFTSSNDDDGKWLDSLVIQCVSIWDARHVDSCLEWMTGTIEKAKTCSFRRMVFFVSSVSGAMSINVETTCTEMCYTYERRAIPEARSQLLIQLALKSLVNLSNPENEAFCSRNGLPPTLSLLRLVAGGCRSQAQTVADLVLGELTSSDGVAKDAMQSVLLRIYLYYPKWMSLGTATLRTALVEASMKHADCWTEWRSIFDDKIDNMVSGVFSGDMRATRHLADMARSHPLLVLRKLGCIVRLLDDDATASSSCDKDSRGVIYGMPLSGPVDATIGGRPLRVTVRHWGYNYTEPVWVALLDVISAIPGEVLFNGGTRLGLLSLLESYVKLITVQLQLRTVDKAARLKSKLSECFAAFRRTAVRNWNDWLGQTIDDSEVRHVLMSCDFITPQEAIESLRQSSS